MAQETSLDKALNVLEAIAQEGDSRLTALVDATGYPPATIHRILAVLTRRRYVRQDPATRKYTLGLKCLDISSWLKESAVYHRCTWTTGVRTWLRRADHASIFLLIGGTYTPIVMLAIGGDDGRHLSIAIWSGVALGVLVSMLWPHAPKFVTATIAVAVGWTIVPYVGVLRRVLDSTELWLIVVGGIAYTVGAVVYAVKRPNPWPRTFGYHEIFHALTLVGAGLHLAAVLSIVHAAAT